MCTGNLRSRQCCFVLIFCALLVLHSEGAASRRRKKQRNCLQARQRASKASQQQDIAGAIVALQQAVGGGRLPLSTTDCVDAMYSLGRFLQSDGKLSAAAETYANLTALTRMVGSSLEPPTALENLMPRWKASRNKVRHDAEQIDYLRKLSPSLASGDMKAASRALWELYENLPDFPVVMPPEVQSRVARWYNKLVSDGNPPGRTGDGEKALGQFDRHTVSTEYMKSGLAVVDNVLSANALQELWRWCREATMWVDSKHSYVGAYFEAGFTSPLLVQVIEELQEAFPDIIGGLPLTYLWAYKYDNAPGSKEGIGLHADGSQVNLNLWLTEDAANLAPGTGGLEIYAKDGEGIAARLNSDKDDEEIERFIKGAPKVEVPYSQNRLVMFRSTFVHRTQSFRFKKGYRNRRINLTFLFGETSTAPSVTESAAKAEDALIKHHIETSRVRSKEL